MIKVFISSLALIIFFVSSLAHAEQRDFQKILSILEKDAEVKAFIPCYLNVYTNAVCLVTEKVVVEGESEFHKRSFLVYNIERGKADRIFLYEQEEYSGLLEITQVDHLTTMAIWATGSATIITLFRVIDKEIKLVLEIGSKFSPEIVDLSGDFIPEILISRGEWIVEKDGHREFRPVKTSIYKFQKDKSKYVETQVVPWKDRFTISEQKPK